MSRRARRPSVERLHRRAREWLLTGHDWEHLGPELGPVGLGGFGSEAEAREAWEANQDALLAEWLEREPYRSGEEMRGGPGTRPWGWWRYAAEAPRHVTGGDRGRKAELRGVGWGTEDAWRTFFGRAWGPYIPVETERAYLARHRLLLPAEREREPAGPWAVE